MKILLLNNYDLTQIRDEWQQDGQAAHQLWGITQLEVYGIQADILPFARFKTLKRLSQKLKIFGDLDQQLRLLLQINRYDLIYSGHYLTTSLLGLLRRLRLINKPIIAISFQAPRPSFFAKIFAQLMIAGNDRLICLSSGIKQHLEQDLGIPSQKLAFIEWGYDTEFHALPATDIANGEKAQYILSIGKSFRDYDTLIAAFEAIDFPLEIIGYSDNLLACLDSIPSNVTVTIPRNAVVDSNHHLPSNQLPKNIKVIEKLLPTAQILPQYYQAYAVAIPLNLPPDKPYNTVGLSSLIEAMCMGKAIIATENQDLGVDLAKEGIGIAVPVQDSVAWKQAVQYLLAHPEATQEMGQKARYLAEQKYNLGNFTQKVAQCMHSLV